VSPKGLFLPQVVNPQWSCSFEQRRASKSGYIPEKDEKKRGGPLSRSFHTPVKKSAHLFNGAPIPKPFKKAIWVLKKRLTPETFKDPCCKPLLVFKSALVTPKAFLGKKVEKFLLCNPSQKPPLKGLTP